MSATKTRDFRLVPARLGHSVLFTCSGNVYRKSHFRIHVRLHAGGVGDNVQKRKVGRINYYINAPLFRILTTAGLASMNMILHDFPTTNFQLDGDGTLVNRKFKDGENLRALRQAMMQELFTGRTRLI